MKAKNRSSNLQPTMIPVQNKNVFKLNMGNNTLLFQPEGHTLTGAVQWGAQLQRPGLATPLISAKQLHGFSGPIALPQTRTLPQARFDISKTIPVSYSKFMPTSHISNIYTPPITYKPVLSTPMSNIKYSKPSSLVNYSKPSSFVNYSVPHNAPPPFKFPMVASKLTSFTLPGHTPPPAFKLPMTSKLTSYTLPSAPKFINVGSRVHTADNGIVNIVGDSYAHGVEVM